MRKYSDEHDSPLIEVQYKGQTSHFTPSEIATIFFQQIKKISELYLTQKVKYRKVTHAILSIPTYFSQEQHDILRDAAKLAGLIIMRKPVEPIMSFLSIGLSGKCINFEKCLVLDLGGKTFDISLYEVDSGLHEMIESGGYIKFGGDDFDLVMVNYFADRFQKKYSCDLRKSLTSMNKLKFACERAKVALSRIENVSIQIESLFEGHDLIDNISRSTFETLTLKIKKINFYRLWVCTSNHY